jgi:hypothetical protein
MTKNQIKERIRYLREMLGEPYVFFSFLSNHPCFTSLISLLYFSLLIQNRAGRRFRKRRWWTGERRLLLKKQAPRYINFTLTNCIHLHYAFGHKKYFFWFLINNGGVSPRTFKKPNPVYLPNQQNKRARGDLDSQLII